MIYLQDNMQGHDYIINISTSSTQDRKPNKKGLCSTDKNKINLAKYKDSAQYINKACCVGVLLRVLYPSFARDQCMILIRVAMYQRLAKRAVPLKNLHLWSSLFVGEWLFIVLPPPHYTYVYLQQ